MNQLQQKIEIIINYFKSEQYDIAKDKVKILLKKHSNIAYLHNLLGMIYKNQKQNKFAIECFNNAISVNKKFAPAYNNLGILYSDGNKHLAKQLFEKSINLKPNLLEAYNNLGNVLRSLNSINESIKIYKKALTIKSDTYEILFNLGNAYQNIGDFKKSEDFYLKTLKIEPHCFACHLNLSLNTKYNKKDNNHLKQMEKINLEKTNKKDKFNLLFALGKAYDDLKKYEQAYNYFIEANKKKRETFNYDMKDEKFIFSNIKDSFNFKVLEKFKNEGQQSEGPIFIVGLPRSGTTLVEQIISNHKNVEGLGELTFIPLLFNKYFKKNGAIFLPKNLDEWKKYDLKKIGNDYLKDVNLIRKNKDKSYFTDKLPNNFLFIGLIKLIFSNAKIIHCQRFSKDNFLSIFMNNFEGKINYAYNNSELANYFNLYSDIGKYWKKHLKDSIYEIKYENLIEDKENEIKNLIKACNLPWDRHCLNFYENKNPILTLSSKQARQKIYKTSVNKYKFYEPYLSKYFNSLNLK